jgi:hypothetical protein
MQHCSFEYCHILQYMLNKKFRTRGAGATLWYNIDVMSETTEGSNGSVAIDETLSTCTTTIMFFRWVWWAGWWHSSIVGPSSRPATCPPCSSVTSPCKKEEVEGFTNCQPDLPQFVPLAQPRSDILTWKNDISLSTIFWLFDLPRTIIKYLHSYHNHTHIILKCQKIYLHYKDNILIRLSHHNHFTQHGKYGASNELLLCFTFSQAKYLGLAITKRAHDICNICIKLPMRKSIILMWLA